jgi:hypothetical protein
MKLYIKKNMNQFIFWGNLVTKFFSILVSLSLLYTAYIYVFKEGFDNSGSKYSHNVDIINNSDSCSNFCGPKSQCATTREQCTSDVDCQGCQPLKNDVYQEPDDLVKPLNDAGKLTFTMTPQYSSLTTDLGTFAAYAKPGSLNSDIPKMYDGYDIWTKSFNYGLGLADSKLTLDQEDYKSMPQYPVTVSATGMFYETGPRASNIHL